MVTLTGKEAKRLKIEVFCRFPPVFQKEFSGMHGVKQTQMKFIIVELAFKKVTFFPASFFLCVIERLS